MLLNGIVYGIAAGIIIAHIVAERKKNGKKPGRTRQTEKVMSALATQCFWTD